MGTRRVRHLFLSCLCSVLAGGVGGVGTAAAQDAPPCTTSWPAIAIVGLDARVDYRELNDFELRETFDAEILGPIDLVMRNEATRGVFFHDPAAETDARYFIRLDPGDGTALVEVAYDEEDDLGAVCRRSIVRRVEPTGRTQSRPRSCRRVVNPYRGSRYEGIDLTRIRATRVSCRVARRVARRAHYKALGMTPPASGIRRFTWNGWRVTGDLRGTSDSYVARRGTKRVTWRF